MNYIFKNSDSRVTSTYVSLQTSQPEKRQKWDSCRQVYIPLSIMLLDAIGAKLIGHHSGHQVDQKVCNVMGSVDWPRYGSDLLWLGVWQWKSFCFSNCPTWNTLHLPIFVNSLDVIARIVDAELQSVDAPKKLKPSTDGAFLSLC